MCEGVCCVCVLRMHVWKGVCVWGFGGHIIEDQQVFGKLQGKIRHLGGEKKLLGFLPPLFVIVFPSFLLFALFNWMKNESFKMWSNYTMKCLII